MLGGFMVAARALWQGKEFSGEGVDHVF